MWQKRREAPAESVLFVLRALGVPLTGIGDAGAALRLRREEIKKRTVDPVVLAWNGRLKPQELRLPTRCKPTLVLEDGSEIRWPPKTLPAGYHRLTVVSQNHVQESLVISAPTRAHFPLADLSWGVFTPVYALHSKRSFGAGDLSDFESVTEWMQKLGGQVIATLPLLANLMEEPIAPSPYAPASCMFWNDF